MDYHHYHHRLLRHLASIPFIWMMLFPIAITDLILEIYHHICFPLYGLPLVKRKEFIRLDRHRLQYLSFTEKVNCTYCAYANGFARYMCEIGARTEGYWCGITHEKKGGFKQPGYQKDFLPYGDEKAYKRYCKK